MDNNGKEPTTLHGLGHTVADTRSLLFYTCCMLCMLPRSYGYRDESMDYGTSSARSLSGFGCALFVIRMYSFWTIDKGPKIYENRPNGGLGHSWGMSPGSARRFSIKVTPPAVSRP